MGRKELYRASVPVQGCTLPFTLTTLTLSLLKVVSVFKPGVIQLRNFPSLLTVILS